MRGWNAPCSSAAAALWEDKAKRTEGIVVDRESTRELRVWRSGSPLPACEGCQQPLPSALLPWVGLRTRHNDQLSSLPHRGVGAAGDI